MASQAQAQIQITANTSMLPAGLRVAAGMMKSFAGGVGGTLSGAAAIPGRMSSMIGHAGAFMLAHRGLDLIIDQGKQVFDFKEQLVRFGLAARKTPADLQGLEASIRGVSSATGLAAIDILRGTRAFVDIAGAEAFTTEKMSLLARVAQASGGDISQLAQVMFQLQHSMKIDDRDLENTFGGLLNMSKDGAIHFAQMAEEINELAPQFARFGVVGREGMNQLAAMMQVTRTGFASVAETGTGMTRIFQGMTHYAKDFRKYGVEVFKTAQDGTKTLKPMSVILDMIKKNDVLRKDPELLRRAFHRSEAVRGIQLLFEGAEKLRELEEAGRVNGTIMQDLGTYAESSSGRMAIAFEKMKNKIADTFTPERIDKFVRAIEEAGRAIEPLMKAVGFIGDVFGKIWSGGKKIRGALTPDDSRLTTPTMAEIQTQVERHGGSELDALNLLQGRRAHYLVAKRAIVDAMDDGGEKTTPASDIAAIRALDDPRDVAGEGANRAAMKYIEDAGLAQERIAEIRKKIAEMDADEAIASGGGRSTSQQDMVAAFNEAIKTTLAPAVSRAISDAATARPVVHIDGNPVASAVGNATGARRR